MALTFTLGSSGEFTDGPVYSSDVDLSAAASGASTGDILVFHYIVIDTNYPGFGTHPAFKVQKNGVDANVYGGDGLACETTSRGLNAQSGSNSPTFYRITGVILNPQDDAWTLTNVAAAGADSYFGGYQVLTPSASLVVEYSQGSNSGVVSHSPITYSASSDPIAYSETEYDWYTGDEDNEWLVIASLSLMQVQPFAVSWPAFSHSDHPGWTGLIIGNASGGGDDEFSLYQVSTVASPSQVDTYTDGTWHFASSAPNPPYYYGYEISVAALAHTGVVAPVVTAGSIDIPETKLDLKLFPNKVYESLLDGWQG